ncbi:phosphoglycolate phosphatase-like HAD superfamily hydrolase [Amaricoccus macauensis]|uniref:Phosphoglycolate phosphatase-like HAD superfamily hydrolase n=1 Tax=Amaricoccus macauensis TaxID=57001 RepID=A0A840SFY5_9RHOB|nr:phosphoglycolate phosphatase-like HAD superfamily hydrolase [Amaricoccus macauensis]
MAAARNAGIPVVLVSFGYGAGRAAALSPEATIDHFRDLPALLESFP